MRSRVALVASLVFALTSPGALARTAKIPMPAPDAPAEVFLAWHKTQKRVITTPSGLQYQVMTKGRKGIASPTDDDIVTIAYKGMLTTGQGFDANNKVDFRVNQVVAGFSEGLKLMAPGAKYRFWIPPALGYGDASPTPAIPPRSVLVFDVEMFDYRNRASDDARQE